MKLLTTHLRFPYLLFTALLIYWNAASTAGRQCDVVPSLLDPSNFGNPVFGRALCKRVSSQTSYQPNRSLSSTTHRHEHVHTPPTPPVKHFAWRIHGEKSYVSPSSLHYSLALQTKSGHPTHNELGPVARESAQNRPPQDLDCCYCYMGSPEGGNIGQIQEIHGVKGDYSKKDNKMEKQKLELGSYGCIRLRGKGSWLRI